MTETIKGIGVTPRSGHGTVSWYRPERELELPGEDVEIDPPEEHDRFRDAVEQAEVELEKERERAAEHIGEAEAEIFEAQIQFLNDPEITGNVEDGIDEGKPAELAVVDGFKEPIERLETTEGIVAERGDDLRDIRDRVLRILTGTEHPDLSDLPEGTVIFAERLTPSDTARLHPENIEGFVTKTGGKTSHAAIIARSLGIPAVVGAGDALDAVEDGAQVVVDGEHGEVIVDPPEERVAAAEEEETAEIREDRVSTEDGHEVEVAANVGTAKDLANAVEQGADGIGLFRTEFLYLDRESPPSEDEQLEVFAEAMSAFPGERVLVRTIDIGGDKPIPYLDLPREENPFLGNRGMRFALSSGEDLFETQVRALLRAASGEGPLSVMFPMISSIEEVRAAMDVVDAVADDLEDEGATFDRPSFGVMVETPAAVMSAGDIAGEVDFMSIGTNDLIQYTMAASRGNESVAHLHDPLYPAVLRSIDRTVEAAHENDIWAGMCGEMAGEARLTELLVGLGLDELSMSPFLVPRVKERVRSTNRAEAEKLAEAALSAETRDEVLDVLGIGPDR